MSPDLFQMRGPQLPPLRSTLLRPAWLQERTLQRHRCVQFTHHKDIWATTVHVCAHLWRPEVTNRSLPLSPSILSFEM